MRRPSGAALKSSERRAQRNDAGVRAGARRATYCRSRLELAKRSCASRSACSPSSCERGARGGAASMTRLRWARRDSSAPGRRGDRCARLRASDPLAQLPWKIVDDVRIERGGCRIETAASEVDATLRNALAARDRRARPRATHGSTSRCDRRRAPALVSRIRRWQRYFDDCKRRGRVSQPFTVSGRLTRVTGLVMEAVGPQARGRQRLHVVLRRAVSASTRRWSVSRAIGCS